MATVKPTQVLPVLMLRRRRIGLEAVQNQELETIIKSFLDLRGHVRSRKEIRSNIMRINIK
jgi:hypothetical protein